MISPDAKDALAREIPASTHCRRALLAGLTLYGSRDGAFVTHRNAIARLFWSLLDDRKSHPIEARPPTRLRRLPTFAIALPAGSPGDPSKPVRKCDRLAELRAAFLACGSLAVGARGYHLEFVLPETARAARLEGLLRAAGVAPKIACRKGRTIAYYKDFDAIVELLTLVGAFGAVLHLEDVRALRETKNRIHRLVNTETANLERTASAAAAQRHAIDYLACAYGLAQLSPAQREIAELRLAYPDESLSELGRRCDPPIAKPTVSGRLGTLARLVERVRRGQGRPKRAR